jgi:hypothetical protein
MLNGVVFCRSLDCHKNVVPRAPAISRHKRVAEFALIQGTGPLLPLVGRRIEKASPCDANRLPTSPTYVLDVSGRLGKDSGTLRAVLWREGLMATRQEEERTDSRRTPSSNAPRYVVEMSSISEIPVYVAHTLP